MNTDEHRYMGVFTLALVAVLTGIAGAEEGAWDAFALRREYNAVSARIDSLVRAMEAVDAEALDVKQLPRGGERSPIPEGMEAVLIFWADDEARVWINGYPVGETRLTPVEVAVPRLYFRERNRIRARCWDTDRVESGFLCGLYLRDPAAGLHPVLVSDGSWDAGEGKAQEITYAHPAPDIPGAKVIWGSHVLGTVELGRTFDRQSIQSAAGGAAASGAFPEARVGRMDYHAFVQGLAVLQEQRGALRRMLEVHEAVARDVPVYRRPAHRSLSLTLGKAGPLREGMSTPVAEAVQAWAQSLPEAQKRLVYPEGRKLKGEGAATQAQQDVADGGSAGKRQAAYRPPGELGPGGQGDAKGGPGGGSAGKAGQEGGEAGGMRSAGAQGGPGRASRWGLLLPTLILASYVGYVILRWQDLTGGEKGTPWAD